MSDNEFSDFKLQRVECEKCGATWINGTHVWRGTGGSSQSSELDLAGLVCNKLGDEKCINPKKGQDGGQTWEYRMGFIDGVMKEKKESMERMRDMGKDMGFEF